jgi:hypothetical protein
MKIDTMTNIKTYIFLEDIKRSHTRFKNIEKISTWGIFPIFKKKNYNYAGYQQNNK